MKTFLTLVASLTLATGIAYAGCGKKETTTGILEKYDATAKALVVKGADGKSVSLTLTPDSKAANVQALVGKTVTVVSEHKKIDSVTSG
ncbi:MAG: hypothetical protein JNN01_11240 [Opitutaceae bacterium]|nr:hypothetical protein [Opitutaceae bacterium]